MIYKKINKEAACKREAEAGAAEPASAGSEKIQSFCSEPRLPPASWALWAGETEEIGVLLAGGVRRRPLSEGPIGHV